MKRDKLTAEIFWLNIFITWLEISPIRRLIYKKKIKQFKNKMNDKRNELQADLDKYDY